MNGFVDWIVTPLAAATGWAIVHSLWQGTLVAVALAVVFAVVKSAVVRYNAACVALFLVLVAFVATLIQAVPETSKGVAIAPRMLSRWQSAAGGDFRNLRGDLHDVVPWLAYFWLAGVLFVGLRNAAGWISVRRLRTRGVCNPPVEWVQRFSRLTAELRISRPVRLLESCLAETPMVLGHIRPLVLMPVGLLTAMPVAQVEAILLHELAHIGRSDYFVNFFQRLVESLLFYHPAVWWISARIRVEREHCCDDTVVAIGTDAHEYAMALMTLEQNRSAAYEPAIAATGGRLVHRVRRLLQPRNSSSVGVPVAALALTICAATAGLAWQNSQTSAGSSDSSPFTKWLNEDVVYIIADAERLAFERLGTDDERGKFIEQFWKRRDPTPDTEKNEMKEEHYRRIAYVNERFATKLAGWKSDRGHVYITFGPPDEIESHPNGRGAEPPFDMWLYRHLDGMGDRIIFRFVDKERSGEYQLDR